MNMLVRTAFGTLTVALLAAGFLFAAPQASAQTVQQQYNDIQSQGIIFAGVCDSAGSSCACRDQGRCELEDILQVVVNITVLIMAISGSVLLVLFVYGGFVWLTSGGSADRVNKGKKILVGAVVGILIVFGAYTAITALISVLKTGSIPTTDENLEDVIGTTGGFCSSRTPDDTLWPCNSDADCLDWLGYNIDLGSCEIPEGQEVIETIE